MPAVGFIKFRLPALNVLMMCQIVRKLEHKVHFLARVHMFHERFIKL
jgi:hypothetical protein